MILEKQSLASTRYPDNGSSDNTFSSYIHSELKIYKKIRWFNALLKYDFNKIQMNFSENNLFNIGSELKMLILIIQQVLIYILRLMRIILLVCQYLTHLEIQM